MVCMACPSFQFRPKPTPIFNSIAGIDIHPFHSSQKNEGLDQGKKHTHSTTLTPETKTKHRKVKNLHRLDPCETQQEIPLSQRR